MEVSILQQILDAKKLFNKYADAKRDRAGEAEALAPFLRSVLGIGQTLWENTETEKERELLKQFGAEWGRAFR